MSSQKKKNSDRGLSKQRKCLIQARANIILIPNASR